MASFLEEYVAHLEALFDKGGTPAHMKQVGDQFNAAGRDSFQPGDFYLAWSEGHLHRCTTCQETFSMPKGLVPNPQHEVTCDQCLFLKPDALAGSPGTEGAPDATS